MTSLDLSPEAIARRVAHLRHVYGPNDPDAALIDLLSKKLADATNGLEFCARDDCTHPENRKQVAKSTLAALTEPQ